MDKRLEEAIHKRRNLNHQQVSEKILALPRKQIKKADTNKKCHVKS